jgi:predicted RNase H-like nuclease (RuvC/YqgF family)
MVTKDDLAGQVDGLRTEIDGLRTEMRQGFASIHAEIRDIRSRLDAIESELKNHSGFAKEIDHLMKRVVDIERHLGIQQKIAA